ncbi:hypothetical protein CEP53_010956 [Fusarium sp. AF-6]|nr:hypothetical protein CEP53_010956 [Fusarium sp. AF-6]
MLSRTLADIKSLFFFRKPCLPLQQALGPASIRRVVSLQVWRLWKHSAHNYSLERSSRAKKTAQSPFWPIVFHLLKSEVQSTSRHLIMR